MIACVTSLKFSPGHLSHIIAYAKLFEALGYNVILWLHEDYKRIVHDTQTDIVWYPNSCPENVSLVLFVNVSTVNHRFAQKLKNSGVKIVYLYHEPWESFNQYLKEGLKQALKATVAHIFSVKMLRHSDLVIVPSNYALQLYKNKDIKHNANVVMVPLLFDDEASGNIDVGKKEYFSYIGHAVKGHAFDKYIDLIKYIYKQGINMKFEIATRTDLSELLRKDKMLHEMIEKEILKLSHGKPLTNSQINEAYARSFCIWNVYRRSTQSGVLPKAYMFGSPVIANSVGSFPEFVDNRETGFLIDLCDFSCILGKLLEIYENLPKMSEKCRQKFLNVFYWKNYVSKISEYCRDDN